MSVRRTPPRVGATGRGRAAGVKWPGRSRWVAVLVVVVVMLGIIAWQVFEPRQETASSPGGLPGPLGGPEIAQDVNTLVGQRAPAFTLPDSAGNSYSVTRGQGRPLVLISHMGVT